MALEFLFIWINVLKMQSYGGKYSKLTMTLHICLNGTFSWCGFCGYKYFLLKTGNAINYIVSSEKQIDNLPCFLE